MGLVQEVKSFRRPGSGEDKGEPEQGSKDEKEEEKNELSLFGQGSSHKIRGINKWKILEGGAFQIGFIFGLTKIGPFRPHPWFPSCPCRP